MSRSKKKVGVYTDSSNSEGKKMASKKYRRVTKQKSKVLTKSIIPEDEDPWLYPDEYEITDPYDVCDYRFYSKDPKAKRK